MIRQAITCDICGTEKKQAKHWFVAYTQAGELRVSAWQAQIKLRAGSKHLCGQTCLHKLVDEFMAGTLVARPQPSADAAASSAALTDASLTSLSASPVPALSFPLEEDLDPLPVRTSVAIQPGLVPVSTRRVTDSLPLTVAAPPLDAAPDYAPRRWRAEAWQREREREVRPPERRTGLVAHFRKSS